jgi:hypothetical protein
MPHHPIMALEHWETMIESMGEGFDPSGEI